MEKKEVDIDIVCPDCQGKAAFFTNGWTGTYQIRPERKGIVVCMNCGLNKSIEFNNELYYFKIPIAGRYLYARTLNNLKHLREFFAENRRVDDDPDFDFPAVFYKNQLKLIQLIDERISIEQV